MLFPTVAGDLASAFLTFVGHSLEVHSLEFHSQEVHSFEFHALAYCSVAWYQSGVPRCTEHTTTVSLDEQFGFRFIAGSFEATGRMVAMEGHSSRLMVDGLG